MGSKLTVVDNSLKIALSLPKALEEGLHTAGKEIVALAGVLAPVDTGELARSGKAEVTAPSTVEVSFGEGLDDERAPAQEYGTVFFPAQPYLAPAIKEVDVEYFIKQAINRKV